MPLVTFDDRDVEFEISSGINSIKLGSVLIQWGTETASANANTHVNFRNTYTNAPLVYLTIEGVSRGVDLRTPQVVSTSTTGFDFFVSARNASSNYYSGSSVAWFAIGTV